MQFILPVFSAPGGTRIDDNDKTKMTNHCVFSAHEDHDALRHYAQVREQLGLKMNRRQWFSFCLLFRIDINQPFFKNAYCQLLL